MIINKIVISDTAPNTKEVGWLLPLEDGTFKLRFYGLNGWIDAASGVQGPQGEKGDTGPQGPKGDKGDTGDTGPVGASVTAIALTTDAEGNLQGVYIYYKGNDVWTTSDGVEVSSIDSLVYRREGTTEERPTSPPNGFVYRDITINKLVWYFGGTWYDNTGYSA